LGSHGAKLAHAPRRFVPHGNVEPKRDDELNVWVLLPRARERPAEVGRGDFDAFSVNPKDWSGAMSTFTAIIVSLVTFAKGTGPAAWATEKRASKNTPEDFILSRLTQKSNRGLCWAL